MTRRGPGHPDSIRERIESAEGESTHLEPAGPVEVEIKEERVTVRLSRAEVEALDREAGALGVGRSTVIRMILRQVLGLASKQAAAHLDRMVPSR